MARRRDHDQLSEFGLMVEAWRLRHGLTQSVVAKLIHAHQRTLSDWLKEDGMPGAVVQIARLAALMGTEVGDLVGNDAKVAPLRDPKFVRDVLAGSVSPSVVKQYLKEAGVRMPPATTEDEA